MNIKYVLTIVFAVLSISGCTQTKPVAVEANAVVAASVVAASVVAPAVATSQETIYAGTATGLLTGLASGAPYERKLNAKITLSFDKTQNVIAGEYAADFISGRGSKVTVTGQLAQTAVERQAFTGTADVTPPKNTPVQYKTQSGSYTGTLSADNATMTGVIVVEGTYTDIQDRGTFTYRLDYSAQVTVPK